MYRLIFLLFLISPVLLSSQQTPRYIKLHKQLKLIEKKPDTNFYRNGKIKSIGTYAKYKYLDMNFNCYVGKLTEYYKNGNIASEEILDEYSHYLMAKFYDRKGRLWEEWEALEIDISEELFDAHIKSRYKSNFKRKINHYNYSSKYKKWYVCRVDYLTSQNNKKFENRIFYNAVGDTIRTRLVNYRNK